MSNPLPACSARAHQRCGWVPTSSLVQGEGGEEEGRGGGPNSLVGGGGWGGGCGGGWGDNTWGGGSGDGLGGGFVALPCRLACNSAPQPACAPTCDGQRVLHPLQQAGGGGKGHHLRARQVGAGWVVGMAEGGPNRSRHGRQTGSVLARPASRVSPSCQAHHCQAFCHWPCMCG